MPSLLLTPSRFLGICLKAFRSQYGLTWSLWQLQQPGCPVCSNRYCSTRNPSLPSHPTGSDGVRQFLSQCDVPTNNASARCSGAPTCQRRTTDHCAGIWATACAASHSILGKLSSNEMRFWTCRPTLVITSSATRLGALVASLLCCAKLHRIGHLSEASRCRPVCPQPTRIFCTVQLLYLSCGSRRRVHGNNSGTI